MGAKVSPYSFRGGWGSLWVVLAGGGGGGIALGTGVGAEERTGVAAEDEEAELVAVADGLEDVVGSPLELRGVVAGVTGSWWSRMGYLWTLYKKPLITPNEMNRLRTVGII